MMVVIFELTITDMFLSVFPLFILKKEIDLFQIG